MPTYTYACAHCGKFELVRSIARRTDPAPCPDCDRLGARVFTSPHLSRLDPSLDRAVTSAGLSGERPEVTRHIPPAARPAPSARPGHPALPRP